MALQSISQSENYECGKDNSHEGKYIIMDQESHEILALDEEIKSKLRDGKEQRFRDANDVLIQGSLKVKYQSTQTCPRLLTTQLQNNRRCISIAENILWNWDHCLSLSGNYNCQS